MHEAPHVDFDRSIGVPVKATSRYRTPLGGAWPARPTTALGEGFRDRRRSARHSPGVRETPAARPMKETPRGTPADLDRKTRGTRLHGLRDLLLQAASRRHERP